MKKVLIISPHFPPINAADMHRIRQSIAYYKNLDWEPEVVVVDPQYVDMYTDDLLLETIPKDILIHKVKAFSVNTTRKFGLGNIGYRAMYYYWKYVNQLLKNSKFDLIFFSTTAFPITILGRIWKKKFNIPYIIDMQDPWRSDHYLELPKQQRPPKFWISYKLDYYLERFAINNADGLMAVSVNYIDVLKKRYPSIKNIPSSVIPFAAYSKDIELAKYCNLTNPYFNTNSNNINIVYIGRAGFDMQLANTLFLKAIKKGIELHEDFKKIRVYYIGTSYAPKGKGMQTVQPIADSLLLDTIFNEFTDRISYFESLKILNDADILFVPGSDNIGYTASKIYQYAWLNKPMLTLFHSSSSVNTFMKECNMGVSLQFDEMDETELGSAIIGFIRDVINRKYVININWNEFEKYTAEYQVGKQVDIFNQVIHTNGIN